MLALAPLLLAAAPQASDVLVVDSTGGGDYTSIQPAVDAAAPGTVILVRPGAYPGFAVAGKALTLIVDGPPGSAQTGAVRIAGTSAVQEVVLSGFDVQGVFPGLNGVGVTVEACLGSVRIESCGITGADNMFKPAGCHGWLDDAGADALLVTNSPNAALVACTLEGGRGVVQCEELFPTECCGFITAGGDGGDALDDRGSNVAAFDSAFLGGPGGTGGWGGQGGSGIRSEGVLVLSGASATGGKGGNGFDYIYGPGGDGGDGLVTTADTTFALDTLFTAGAPGPGIVGGPGEAGDASSGAPPVLWTGSARSLTLPAPTPESALMPVGVQGEPGDLVFVFTSFSQSFLLFEAYQGVALVGTSKAVFLGTGDAAGQLQVSVPLGVLPPGQDALRFAGQLVCLTSAGGVAIGPPRHQVILDASF